MTRCITDHTPQLPPAISSAQNIVVQRTIGYLLNGIYRGTQVLSTDVDKVTTLQKARWNSNKRVSMRYVLLKMSAISSSGTKGFKGGRCCTITPDPWSSKCSLYLSVATEKAGWEYIGPFLPVF